MSAPPLVCLICLSPEPADAEGAPYHRACLERLFGAPTLPRIAFDRAAVIGWAGERSARMSLAGYQPKAPLRLSDGRSELLIVERDADYIVKPQHGLFAYTPENEHLSMCLARLVGLTVAECGLFALADRSPAYITRRFDRVGAARSRRALFDFCQLAGRDPDDKEDGSAEECASLARRYADDRAATSRALFRLFVFSSWIGNGDMHLKNIALLEGDDGKLRLSPAYDLLSTHVYGGTAMSLPLHGKFEDFTRDDLLTYAEHECGITREEAGEILAQMVGRLDDALAMVDRSPLPEGGMKEKYRSLLASQGELLLRSSSPPPPAAP